MITALLWGLGLVLVIEGLVYALAPSVVETLLEKLRQIPSGERRLFGILMAFLGALILFVVVRYLN